MPLAAEELSRRLHLLFAAVRAAGEQLRSPEQLVGSAADSAPLTVDRVEELRAGHGAVATDAECAAIARFFGVPAAYLTGVLPAGRIEAQLQLLVGYREWEHLWLNAQRRDVLQAISPSMIVTEGEQGEALRAPMCMRLTRSWRPPSEEDEVGTGQGPQQQQHVLKRCQVLVHELDRTVGIPVPFELELFLTRLQQQRGARPIELFPMAMDELPPDTCGLWLNLADRDVIGFPAGVPRNHRDHIVMHEIGHMVAEHAGSIPVPGGTLTQLLPDLDPDMVRAVLGRSVYTDLEEQEAELIASLIMHRSLGVDRRWAEVGAGDAVADRVARTFGSRPGRRAS